MCLYSNNACTMTEITPGTAAISYLVAFDVVGCLSAVPILMNASPAPPMPRIVEIHGFFYGTR